MIIIKGYTHEQALEHIEFLESASDKFARQFHTIFKSNKAVIERQRANLKEAKKLLREVEVQRAVDSVTLGKITDFLNKEAEEALKLKGG